MDHETVTVEFVVLAQNVQLEAFVSVGAGSKVFSGQCLHKKIKSVTNKMPDLT